MWLPLPAKGASFKKNKIVSCRGEGVEQFFANRRFAPRLGAAACFALAPLFAAAAPIGVARGAQARHYEQVSPVAKNDGDVMVTVGSGLPYFNYNVTRDGQGVGYQSHGSYNGAPGNGFINNYVAKRRPDGWESRPVDAPDHNPRRFQSMTAFSADLSAWLLIAGDPGLTADAPPDTWNYYRSDGAAYTLVSSGLQRNDSSSFFAGGSADLSTIAFETGLAQTPDAPAGTPNAYASEGAGVRLIGYLPDGSIAPSGVYVGGGRYGSIHNAVSVDGRTIFFTDAATGQLYARLSGTRTVALSESQRTTPEAAQPATYWDATPDGRYAFFTTAEGLVDEDNNATSDIYRYDLERRELVPLTLGGGADANALGVIGASDTGGTVYFFGGPNYVEGAQVESVYVLRGGVARAMAPGAVVLGAVRQRSQSAELSTNGERLAFLTLEGLVDGDLGGQLDLYTYDAAAGTLRCASCRTDGVPATTPVLIPAQNFGAEALDDVTHASRFSTADGTTLFFTTAEPLVDSDLNGMRDAYEYDSRDGSVRLVSDGKSAADSYFVGVSDSGDDVFFTTRAALLPQDRDDNVDLYDARRGSRFPAAPVEPDCAGDGCQGAYAEQFGGTAIVSAGEQREDSVEDLPAGRLTVLTPSRRARQQLRSRGSLTVALRANRAGTVTGWLDVTIRGTAYRAAVASSRVVAGRELRLRLVLRNAALRRRLRSNAAARGEVVVSHSESAGVSRLKFSVPTLGRRTRAARSIDRKARQRVANASTHARVVR
jgi:hypothetical protein